MKKLRYRIREPLARWFLHSLARLPFAYNQRLGTLIGYLSYRLSPSLRQTVTTNLRKCFPDWDEQKVLALSKQSLLDNGKSLTEVGPIWLWPASKLNQLIVDVQGEQRLTEALKRGKGAIILTPHLGSWEMVGVYLTQKYAMTTLYRPHRIQSLSEIMIAGRKRLGGQLAPTNQSGVKQLFKAIHSGELIGMLPDQDPGDQNGVFAPFFGISTNTMVLLSRIAQKTSTPVISCWAERLPQHKGYRIHFSETSEELGNKDLAVALRAMNEEVEKMIRQNPTQYQWSYKRFRRRPENEPPFYTT